MPDPDSETQKTSDISDVNVFGSATVEPKKGVSDNDLVEILLARPEVKSCKILIPGFLSVRFVKALRLNDLWKLKEELKESAYIHEHRLRELHQE